MLPTSNVDDEGKGDATQAQTELFSHIFCADFQVKKHAEFWRMNGNMDEMLNIKKKYCILIVN